MSTTEIATAPVDEQQDEAAVWASPEVPFSYRKSRATHLVERGMATAEYAIGVLAAIAIALLLAKALTGAQGIDSIVKMVTQAIGKVGSTIKP